MKTFEVAFSATTCGTEFIEAKDVAEAEEIFFSGRHRYGDQKNKYIEFDTSEKPSIGIDWIEEYEEE